MLARHLPLLRLAGLLCLLLLGGCAPAMASDGPTTGGAPTPTRTPWPTLTPLPTYTPTATPPPPPSPTPAVPLMPPATPGPVACTLPDLAFDQHISARGSYTEGEWDAAGITVCQLRRNSCGYHRLIGITDPSIRFKREERSPYDTEDSMVHPAMLLPLTRLNEMVQSEWGGAVQLRVTEAYDSQLVDHHLSEPDPRRKIALHYEGRSIDLTTYPVDPALYGRLCALAHCAGFDWVHNEGDHCHASINAISLCFARCN